MKIGRRPLRIVAATCVILGVLGTAAAALAAASSTRSTGPDYRYGDANPFDDASAVIHVVHTGHEGTHVTLHITGVDAPGGRTFGAHVHVNPCGPSGADAGGHYQHAAGTGSLEDREVWLDFTVNAAGNAHAEALRPWPLDDGSPRSVIIHEAATNPETAGAGARLACIDLDGA
jgi:superoxide dismutase, Cu-Zn family